MSIGFRDSMSFAEAAMLEPVSVALHAVKVSDIRGGETALVIGAGMIGLLTLQAARAAGCSRVSSSPMWTRRASSSPNPSARLRPFTLPATISSKKFCGYAPAPASMWLSKRWAATRPSQAAIDCVRKGGTVTLIGNIAPQVTLPLQKVVTRQMRLQGTVRFVGEYPQAIELIASGVIQVKPLITAVAPLAEGPRWFERLYAHEPNLMKIVLTPRPESAA